MRLTSLIVVALEIADRNDDPNRVVYSKRQANILHPDETKQADGPPTAHSKISASLSYSTMFLAWPSLRSVVSYRSLAAVLVVCVLVLSLRSLVHPHPFHLPPVFHFDDVHPIAEHAFTGDGRLLVNPDAPHPIFQLIRDAEAAWDAKLARASKTLDEAIAEYRRRYRRAPPLGFDKWYVRVVPAPQRETICDHTTVGGITL